MKKNILDLRFIIGAFFSLIGILLCGYAYFAPSGEVSVHQINWHSGLVYLLFGLLMLCLWFFFPVQSKD